MNKRQENKLSMYIFVEETCNSYQSVWNETGIFSETKEEFGQHIHDILDVHKKQIVNTTGVTRSRDKLSAELIDITLKHAGILKVYAEMNADEDLLHKVSLSKSDISMKRDTTKYNICHAIYETVNTYRGKLDKYGLPAEAKSEFKKALENFKAKLPATTAVRKGKKRATEDLADLFEQTDRILTRRMDNLMLLFKETSPVFYKAYIDARKIEHRGIRHVKKQDESGKQAA